MIEFRMPSLGADMDKATLVQWLKKPGDKIERGDILAIVETVKGAIEIESFDEGVLESHVVAPGTTIPVGETLAFIRNGNDEGVETAPAPDRAEALKATPAARKRAQDAGIELAQIAPGAGGVIGLEQVDAAIAGAKGTDEGEKKSVAKAEMVKPGLDLDAMRAAIGSAMARSKREIPHYYVSTSIDCTALINWLETENGERAVTDRLLYAAPLIKAVAIALKKVPDLNGFYKDDRFHAAAEIHIGVATALRGGGLIAPALHNTGDLTVDDCMVRLRDLVGRVRSGRLRGSEMSDPTVTISILGEETAEAVSPVIYPPQVAIIGCGAIVARPWVINGDIKSRQIMTVTIAGDHRASDGRIAARFLNHLSVLLQEPEQL